jgi:outer membrane biogenesis lipoprotein LolB
MGNGDVSMRFRSGKRLLLVAVVLLTACGSRHSASPATVARTWSAALDRADDAAAASWQQTFPPAGQPAPTGSGPSI